MIPASRPHIDHRDGAAVDAAVRSTFVAGGPAVGEFEAAVAARWRRRHGVAVTSGTSALVIAVGALGLPPGTEVLVPALTIVSALHAIRVNACVPVFADVDPKTWNVSLETVAAALKGRAVKAAIIVETYRSAPPMADIESLLREHGVHLIEDAAEGLGGAERDRPFGAFGAMSTLSFYPNKLITTGEGGMVLTDDDRLCARLRGLRNLCFDAQRRYVHAELSGNYRMTNLQAALGLAQIQRVDEFYAHRERLDALYRERLVELDEHLAFQMVPPRARSSFWTFPVVLRAEVPFDAVEFVRRAKDEGFEARHFFHPLDRQPCLADARTPAAEVSLRLSQRGICLPLGNGITVEEVERVCERVRRILCSGGRE